MAPTLRGVRVSRVLVGGDELAIVSVPLAQAVLPASLTEAERRVAVAVLAGRSNAAIARDRGTSVRTVANQVASVLRKCGVSSRRELALRLRHFFRS